MCGRYSLFKVSELADRFDAYDTDLNLEANYNIAPGNVVPVVTRHSPNRIELMKWGLVPFWAIDPKIGYKMINARAEGIESKPAFRKPIRSQRCLVPSNGFFEWKKITLEKKEEKIPWFIGLKNQSTFALAGLYDIWKDGEGVETRSFTIITTEPNDMIKEIHNRMPVIIKNQQEDDWLDPSTSLEDILGMLKPFPSTETVGYPVSARVNNPDNKDASLIEPA